MESSSLTLIEGRVLWAGFFVSMAFGAIAQRTRFCTMGAIADVVNFGDWTRVRQWGMAVGIAMIGFAGMAFAGWIDPGKSLYASERFQWLSALAGGLLFGVGMVLASGCGSKNLVRIGGGSLKAFVVVLVMAISAYATLKGLTAVWRVGTVDRVALEFAGGTALSDWASASLGTGAMATRLMLSLLLGGALMLWALSGADFRQPENLLAGLGIGGVVIAMWWVSGHLGHVAEHPQTLQEVFASTNSGRMEALTFVAPTAYALDWFILFSDKNKVLTIGIVSVFGVVAGSALQSVLSGQFRWEGFGGTEDLANHIVGAALMGVGGVTALGCTIGQGLSGLSTLSAASFLAVSAIVLGAVLAIKYQAWRLERMA